MQIDFQVRKGTKEQPSRGLSASNTAVKLFVAGAAFAAIGLAQQQYSWRDNPPPVEIFGPTFDKVWAASLEPEPFQSIKGKYDPDQRNWLTTVALSGGISDECRIGKNAHVGWQYQCIIGDRRAYINLSNLLQDKLKDWKADPRESEDSIFFFAMEQEQNGTRKRTPDTGYVNVRYVSTDAGGDLFIYQPSHVIDLHPPVRISDQPRQSLPGLSGVDAQIATILASGRYSALPAPQTAIAGSPGGTVLSITNGTQYALRILAAGPTSEDYTIAPAETQDFAISPGSYKLVGSVSASNVLPFYGAEIYVSGSRYVYRFYVK